MSPFTTRPELRGTLGMVASTHWLASGVGMRMLELGGNAFDAAVAAGFTLQVVEPHLNGPGGDLPVVFWSARERAARVLCAQGVAPAAATIRRFAELGLDQVPGTGLLATCVPGAFDGWLTLLRDHGTMTLVDVLAPALHYAEHGYPVVPGVAGAIESVRTLFEAHWPTSAAVYLPRGSVPAVGTRFGNLALAATYRRLLQTAQAAGGDREHGIEAARACWHTGFVAEAIASFSAEHELLDSSGERHSGLLTGDDLASWESSYESALTFDYDGLTVCKTGPWGQGPVFLAQLALLRGFDLQAMGIGSAEYVHTVIECAKLAFADREAWYGDPAFGDVPVVELLSETYNAQRRGLVTDVASGELRPGSPAGRTPRLPGAGDAVQATGTGEPTMGSGEPTMGSGEPTMRTGESTERSAGPTMRTGEPTTASGPPSAAAAGLGPGDTCHVDVVDRFGNFVSATPSGGWLQSSPVIPALGFCLGTRAQMFTLTPDLPNSLAPGKRPRTTLSPSLVLRDGEPYLAFGTPGGDQQDQWTLAFLLGHHLFGLDLQAAIDAPAFHTEHFPSSFYPHGASPRSLHLESRFGDEVIRALRDRGHEATVSESWSLGRVSAVGREPDGILKAAANARGMQGYAVGR
jgi:gamma-glutamyltranspeptidase/glutathione hydrolase